MQVGARCPICGRINVVDVTINKLWDTPTLSVDEEAVSDSTEFECRDCRKELRVIVSVELFE